MAASVTRKLMFRENICINKCRILISDSENYLVRDQYKVNCFFLLFRRVICELITENLDLNASTFDFCPLQALVVGEICLRNVEGF